MSANLPVVPSRILDEPASAPPQPLPRAPVRTYAELQTLDHAEIVEGYNDGWAGEPEPGDNRSKSYWHGWRNAHLDRAQGPPDADAIELVRDIRRHGGFERWDGS